MSDILRRLFTETWPAKAAKSALESLMVPGQVASGQLATKPTVPGMWSDEDESRSQLTQQGIGNRATDLAGLVMGGSYAAAPAMKNASGMGIRAYHGSPHDFDRFDLSKIGTGEGAQVYGHGLYFAENEGVARSYRDALAPIGVDIFRDGKRAGSMKSSNVVNDPDFVKAYNELIPASVPGWIKSSVMKDIYDVGAVGSGPVDIAAAMQKSVQRNTKDLPESAKAQVADAIKLAYDSVGNVEFRRPGRMYEVDIKANPEQFLDWDKPMAAQSPRVLDVMGETRNAGKPTGQQRYLEWAKDFGDPYGATVSKVMKDAGIPGIKYLDQGSRGAGEGSRNYVVFDDKLVDILRKYGIAGTAGPLAALMMGGESQAQPTAP